VTASETAHIFLISLDKGDNTAAGIAVVMKLAKKTQ